MKFILLISGIRSCTSYELASMLQPQHLIPFKDISKGFINSRDYFNIELYFITTGNAYIYFTSKNDLDPRKRQDYVIGKICLIIVLYVICFYGFRVVT